MTTLRSLLDPRRVRADLRERDKYPNVDGYIALVDGAGRPRGKIEIQIKTLGAGATSCRCPSSLVAYSKEGTTLPVMLVGVDPSMSRAYWTQVSEVMPGYQRAQQTFTVHFTGALDVIDRSEACPCYHRWLEIVREYQTRMHKYKLVAPDRSQRGTSISLARPHWDALQRYVDTLNRLLDDDFISVKKLLFPGVWKFGVGYRVIDQDRVLYQLSSIPRGEPAPLIFELPDDVATTPLGRNVHTTIVQPRQKFLSAPEQCAREYVLGFVRNLWQAKAFPVHGLEMAADVVFGFVQRYHRWLEIPADSDQYRMEDLRRAFGPVLSKTTGAAAARTPGRSSDVLVVDLDKLNQATDSSAASPDHTGTPRTYIVSSTKPPIRMAFASLALLSSSCTQTVKRLCRTRDLPYQPSPNDFIWSCFSRRREIDNVTALLSSSVREYEIFVRGNAFRLASSPYLDPTVSILFEYVSSHDTPRGPELREWHLRDPHRTLEKTTILVADASTQQLDFPSIMINNTRFEVTRKVSRSADFFFAHCPLWSLIYRFLADDLHREYQIHLN